MSVLLLLSTLPPTCPRTRPKDRRSGRPGRVSTQGIPGIPVGMAASHCFQAVGPGTGLERSASGFSPRVVAPTLRWSRYSAVLLLSAIRPDRTWSATPMTISAQKAIPTTKRTNIHISTAPSLTRSPHGSSIGRVDSGSIEAMSIDKAAGKSVLLSSAFLSVWPP